MSEPIRPPIPCATPKPQVKIPRKIEDVIRICAADHGVTMADILSGRRFKNITCARQQACQVLRRMGFSMHQIGWWLRIDSSSVAVAQRKDPLRREFPSEPVGEYLKRILPAEDLSGEWAI